MQWVSVVFASLDWLLWKAVFIRLEFSAMWTIYLQEDNGRWWANLCGCSSCLWGCKFHLLDKSRTSHFVWERAYLRISMLLKGAWGCFPMPLRRQTQHRVSWNPPNTALFPHLGHEAHRSAAPLWHHQIPTLFCLLLCSGWLKVGSRKRDFFHLNYFILMQTFLKLFFAISSHTHQTIHKCGLID